MSEPKRARGRPPVYASASERKVSKSYALTPDTVRRVAEAAKLAGVSPSVFMEEAARAKLAETDVH